MPNRVHWIGLAIRRDVPAGRVLTLAPIVPLEGKLDVFPEFATGPFAARVAPMVGQDDQTLYRLLDEDDLRAALTARPARRRTLLGEGRLEAPLRNYAQAERMAATPFGKDRELWRPASGTSRPRIGVRLDEASRRRMKKCGRKLGRS